MVVTTSYQTVHVVSVILTVITRVVAITVGESVVTLLNIVSVHPAQTTNVCTQSGGKQMVLKSGDMTGCVEVTSPYLTVHLVSVILTVGTPVVINQILNICV